MMHKCIMVKIEGMVNVGGIKHARKTGKFKEIRGNFAK